MKRPYPLSFSLPHWRSLGLALCLCAPALGQAGTVTITIAPLTNNHSIQKTVFGGNEDYGPGQATVASTGAPGGHDTIPNATYMRLGGNRLSSFNWENNADNAGADYGPFMSDLAMLYWVGATQDLNQAPALGVTGRYDQWRSLGKEVLHTIQLMGWVAADNAGVVNAGQEPPSTRWKQVLPAKGAAFTLNPNDADNFVYMDEYVNFLVNRYGNANAGGIKYYNLDNEPGAWDITHVRGHPAHITYAEMAAKSTATAAAITAVDPGAQVLGPAFWGYQDIRYFAGWSTPNASDAAAINATNATNALGVSMAYTWAANYYLDRMRVASNALGRRILHYLDFHYYPEALGTDSNRIIYGNQANSTTQPCAEARMQAPRSLWDPAYIENSWLTGGTTPFQLLPRLQTSINNWYPGTKLSISEYYFGADWDVSGGIAQADVLGVFARFDVAGNYWQLDNGAYSTESYTRAAFNLWLDYDGAGGKVGDIYADAATTDWTATSAYAARSSTVGNQLWVVVLNKNYSATQAVSINLGLSGGMQATAVAARRFGTASATLAAANTHAFTATTITDTLPARSATVYIVTLNSSFLGTPTFTATRTRTPTPTVPPLTATPSRTATLTWTRTVTPTNTVPANTPTPSPTGTLTRSPTPTWTRTATATNTVPSNTLTSTPTRTATATQTLTHTLTWTRTSTPTQTLTHTPTGTRTATATNTAPANTATATPTPTPTWTRSSTATQTLTHTPTGTRTATATNTVPANTATSTPTHTPTATRTATGTGTLTGTPSASPTASRTSTPSQTLSATPSDSPSRTASPSVTVTLSATLTHTPVPPLSTLTSTPTATPTYSPSSTRSPTGTLTATPSITLSVTLSTTGTPTDTRTGSPTPSSTGTLTATPSASPTRTATLSATPSPSATETHTPVPPLSSFTATPTQSPALSPTPSMSPTGSVTPTATQTLTRTPTLTETATMAVPPTPTASPTRTLTATPTATLTITATATRSSTGTLTGTPSATASYTGTRTATPSPSATLTATLSASPTLSSTRTATLTVTPTATATATATQTRTATPTVTVTLSATQSATPIAPQVTGISPNSGLDSGGTAVTLTGSGFQAGATVLIGGLPLSGVVVLNATTITGIVPPHAAGAVDVSVTNTDGGTGSLPLAFSYLAATATVTPTCTASPEAGPLEVLEHRAWPNPNPRAISVKLSRSADLIQVKLWTRDLKLVCVAEASPAPGGWSQVALPSPCSNSLANGAYFYTVSAQLHGASAKGSKPGKLVVLR